MLCSYPGSTPQCNQVDDAQLQVGNYHARLASPVTRYMQVIRTCTIYHTHEEQLAMTSDNICMGSCFWGAKSSWYQLVVIVWRDHRPTDAVHYLPRAQKKPQCVSVCW